MQVGPKETDARVWFVDSCGVGAKSCICTLDMSSGS